MLSPEDIKKYTKLDPCLKFINSRFITVAENDRQRYSSTFTDILQLIREKMREQDPVYRTFEGTPSYAGSAFDKIKVGKPDEFDMNIEIKLPAAWKNTDDVVVANGKNPSYVTINVKRGLDRFGNDKAFMDKFGRAFGKWMDSEGYLIQDKFHSWMEGVVQRALNCFQSAGGGWKHVDIRGVRYKVKADKSGPAVTLRIQHGAMADYRIDVDLVPVIPFNTSPHSPYVWPKPPVRARPSNCQEKSWCAVPKPKKNGNGGPNIGNREWRISFAKQEREMLYNKGCMKSTIRQLKKLKASNEVTKNLPSYFVKTVFLWDLHEPQDKWTKHSNGAHFMFMLKKLHEYLCAGKLFFYWDQRNNMLDACGNAVDNMKHRIALIIKDIDQGLARGDPLVLAQYLLTSEELPIFKRTYNANGGGGDVMERLSNLTIDGAGVGDPIAVPSNGEAAAGNRNCAIQ